MKRTVLLIDNDEISIFVNTRLLEKKGRCSHCHVARNGQEALEYFLDCQSQNRALPDLVFLDVNMPLIDAHEFLYQYERMELKDKDKVRVILLSTDPSKIRGKRKDHFVLAEIVKPLTMEKLDHLFELLDKNAEG